MDFMDSGRTEGILRNDFQRLSDKIFGKDVSEISEEAHYTKIRKAIFNDIDLMQIISNIPEKGLHIDQLAKMPIMDKKNLQNSVDYLLRNGVVSAKEITFGSQRTMYILTESGVKLASEIKNEHRNILKRH
jgi:predicted transcriptional regulator